MDAPDGIDLDRDALAQVYRETAETRRLLGDDAGADRMDSRADSLDRPDLDTRLRDGFRFLQ